MAVTINGTTGIVTPDIGVDGSTLVIDSVNNRIGIGTDNPQTKLHLASGGQIRIDNPSNGNFAKIQVVSETVANAADLTFHVGTGEALRIANNGNVGIGTESPNYELSINASDTISVLQLTNSTTGSTAADGFLSYITGSNVIISNEENGYMRFQTSGLERMRIDSSGAVTISTGDLTVNSLTVGRGAGNVSTNTAVGVQALYNNTTGYSNTANGLNALFSNTTGINNVANGVDALRSNTTGNYNIANGQAALFSNTTGYSNTANGLNALFSNTTGINNVANGVDALRSNTTGNYNVANGQAALFSNTTGYSNTANGLNALFSNTTGINNVANGVDALRSNTTGSYNVANGVDALRSNTTGNNNVANGRGALYNNTTGINNVANGRDALRSNTTGNYNTANGRSALRSNTTGHNNTANGFEALRSNTTGSYNVANGRDALRSNTTGIENTANGRDALRLNTTGDYNTANGLNALRLNTTGHSNTANGRDALYNNTTGHSNTANGRGALYNNTTGHSNTANGRGALFSNTTGDYNTANGVDALFNNTTGSGNFGAAFRNNAGTYAPVFDPTTENNRVVMGHTSVTNAYVQVAWTVVSDARDKMNFTPVPHGLDFINQLQPTAYQFKVDRDTEQPNGPVRYGFKAQDILALEGDNPVIIDTEDENRLKYKGEHLVPVLVKAVQELSATVSNLKAENAAFKSRLDAAGI